MPLGEIKAAAQMTVKIMNHKKLELPQDFHARRRKRLKPGATRGGTCLPERDVTLLSGQTGAWTGMVGRVQLGLLG